jgi:DNA polymerase-3 subunit epsilon
MGKKRAIFFDFETTGTNPEYDRIIEVAAFDPERNRHFEALVNPKRTIPNDVIAVHKITNEMVEQAEPFEIVGKKLLEFCEGDVAMVAHNGDAFDVPFLKAECKRVALAFPHHVLFIDTLKWARIFRSDLPRHSLQFLRQSYGIQENKAHRALNDVMILHEVYKHMVDDLDCETVHALIQKRMPQEKQKQEAPALQPAQNDTLLLFT